MFKIRLATAHDAAALAQLAETTFRATFTADNTAADMDLYVAQSFSEEKQRAEIADSVRTVMVAETEGEDGRAGAGSRSLIGYYVLLEGSTDPAVTVLPRPVELQRIYVDFAWHGKGVAGALLESVMSVARSKGYQTLWLGVWEENLRAQKFYKKAGFREVGTHVFVLGNDPQTDLVLARDL